MVKRLLLLVFVLAFISLASAKIPVIGTENFTSHVQIAQTIFDNTNVCYLNNSQTFTGINTFDGEVDINNILVANGGIEIEDVGIVPVGASGNLNVNGGVDASYFIGNGTKLTGVCLANGTNCVTKSMVNVSYINNTEIWTANKTVNGNFTVRDNLIITRGYIGINVTPTVPLHIRTTTNYPGDVRDILRIQSAAGFTQFDTDEANGGFWFLKSIFFNDNAAFANANYGGGIVFRQGNFGFATQSGIDVATVVGSKDVGTEGGFTVGKAYNTGSGLHTTVPTNGLIVQNYTGIGTNTPKEMLEVNGTAIIRRNLTVTGNVTVGGDIRISTNGSGLFIKEGNNAKMGNGTMTSGKLVVSTTAVTANSRIFVTDQGGSVANVGSLYISARTPGVQFNISSTNILDASDVAWMIVEPV